MTLGLPYTERRQQIECGLLAADTLREKLERFGEPAIEAESAVPQFHGPPLPLPEPLDEFDRAEQVRSWWKPAKNDDISL